MLAEQTLRTAAVLIALGLDPEKATLFVQSHVARHSELARLFSAIVNVGELKRMIQFKEKSAKDGQEASLSLLDYPVLMAADILLYGADVVPVGEDQKQHLELARDIAQRFNHRFVKSEGSGLVVPRALVTQEAARIMSLTDGTKKMSKSDTNKAGSIFITDSESEIRAKIKRAKTDGIKGLEFGNVARPEVHNLLTIYQVVTGKTRQCVEQECRSMGFGEFKTLLADAVVAHLSPFANRFRELISDRGYLEGVLKAGAEKATAKADETYSKVRSAMGFLTF